MSDIFGGMTGFRFPDARINGGGPLPTDLSGPAGINGDPDGRINFNSDLLSGLNPYSGPGTGRMGSDKSYQQIPHRMQYFIPKLWLPTPDGRFKFPMSHAVDQGDVAFLLKVRQKSFVLFEHEAPAGSGEYVNVDIFVNLATANYLIRGLIDYHNATAQEKIQQIMWCKLSTELRLHLHPDRTAIALLMSFIPWGICAGSEKQGGLHETGLAPVQAACSHITTMTIDGQSRDLVNLWQACDVSAGDTLIFRLGRMRTRAYTLNHYYKGVVSQAFDHEKDVLQIVPDVYRVDCVCYKNPGTTEIEECLNYHRTGFWRVAQPFTRKRKFKSEQCVTDDSAFLQGQLLEVTFAPVWMDFGQTKLKHKSPDLVLNTGLVAGLNLQMSAPAAQVSVRESAARMSTLAPVTQESVRAPITPMSTLTSASQVSVHAPIAPMSALASAAQVSVPAPTAPMSALAPTVKPTAQVPTAAPITEQNGDTRNVVAQQEHRKRKVTKKNDLLTQPGVYNTVDE